MKAGALRGEIIKSHKITNGSPKVGDKGVHSCSRPSFTRDRIWMGGGERTLLRLGV